MDRSNSICEWNLYYDHKSEAYAAAVNLLAVEFLVKHPDEDEYKRWIHVVYGLSDADLELLGIILSINRHISTVGAMITQGDYLDLVDDLLTFLNQVEEERKNG